ncbi:MAG: TIGR01459 family HAD-type hydrolase [Pseudomonadota bacterium]
MSRIITSLAEIAEGYDGLFCDLWGCLHNGVRPFEEAVAALRRFRSEGGRVLLLTNAPRPRVQVGRQLDRMGVPHDCYDAIVSSGDAAQAGLLSGSFGARVYHIGTERDATFFEEVAADIPRRVEIQRVPLAEAESIVCTGLFDDETETPDDYRATYLEGVNRGLKFLCANPDIFVDRGEQRLYCAGALAAAYAERGGEVHYFGKPHAPIYTLARQRLNEVAGEEIADDRILAIGDGILTDIAGGVGDGFDTLFVAGGLAAEETGMRNGQPDPAQLARFLDKHRLSPTASIGMLR